MYDQSWCKKWLVQMSDELPPPPYEVSTVAHSESADNDEVHMKIAIQNCGSDPKHMHLIQRVLFAVRRTNASEAIKGQFPSIYQPMRDIDFSVLESKVDPGTFFEKVHGWSTRTASEVTSGHRGEHTRMHNQQTPPGASLPNAYSPGRLVLRSACAALMIGHVLQRGGLAGGVAQECLRVGSS